MQAFLHISSFVFACESYLENRISKIKIQASVDRKWKHFREAEVMMKIETSKTI